MSNSTIMINPTMETASPIMAKAHYQYPMITIYDLILTNNLRKESSNPTLALTTNLLEAPTVLCILLHIIS